jgi:hypothetical protein
MIIAFALAVLETWRLGVAVYTRAVSAESPRNVGCHATLPVRVSAPTALIDSRRFSEK